MVKFDFIAQEVQRDIPYSYLFGHCINDAEQLALLFLFRLVDGQSDAEEWFENHPAAYANAEQILFMTESMDRLYGLVGQWEMYIRFWMRSRIRVAAKRLIRKTELADARSIPGYGIF